jgi:hypothetical protein
MRPRPRFSPWRHFQRPPPFVILIALQFDKTGDVAVNTEKRRKRVYIKHVASRKRRRLKSTLSLLINKLTNGCGGVAL